MTFLVPRGRKPHPAQSLPFVVARRRGTVVPPYVRLKKKRTLLFRGRNPRHSLVSHSLVSYVIGKCLKENQIGRLIFYMRLGFYLRLGVWA